MQSVQKNFMGNIKNTIKQVKDYRPKIDFYIDADKEASVAMLFLQDKEMSYSPHKDLEYLLQEKDEAKIKQGVKEFVKKFYKIHQEEIKANFESAKKNWRRVEKSFYNKVDELLGHYPWPKGEYSGMASVLNIYPRNIEKKWFTFPAKNQMRANRVIAHEMLHFIVYDYMEKKYGLEPSECYHKNNKFWQFTENLNCLIEGEKMWEEFLDGDKKVYLKEDCRHLYEKMQKVWDKKKDIDHLIKKIFAEELRSAAV